MKNTQEMTINERINIRSYFDFNELTANDRISLQLRWKKRKVLFDTWHEIPFWHGTGQQMGQRLRNNMRKK